jgi:very-short-patch-repair endonuclease
MKKSKIMKENARTLRANMTKHESKIWTRIRKKKIDNIQFYRQKVLGPYIVDFYAPTIKLVLEIDGSHHFEINNLEQDKLRDEYLRMSNIHILRFTNFEIEYYLEEALEKLYDVIQTLKVTNFEKS